MFEFSAFILWIVFSALAGSIAKGKGRSAPAYFFASIIFTPIVGVILALAVSPDKKELENREIEAGTARRCPRCAELVKIEAAVCKHCGGELPAIPKDPPGFLARVFSGK